MIENIATCQSAVCLTLEQATNVYGLIFSGVMALIFIVLLDMGIRQ